jgi:WD40 repeat protein
MVLREQAAPVETAAHVDRHSVRQPRRIWDAAKGKEIVALCGHEGLVGTAAFSPDGTRIVTASNDKTARI